MQPIENENDNATVLPADGWVAGIIKSIEDDLGANEVFNIINQLKDVVERQKKAEKPNVANITFYEKVLKLLEEVPVRREQATQLKTNISTLQMVNFSQREQIEIMTQAVNEFTTIGELYYDKSLETYQRIRNARNARILHDIKQVK